MDDTPRGLRDEQMTGRGDESTRNYAGTDRPSTTDRTTAARTPSAARPRSGAPGSTAGEDDDADADRRAREIRAEIEQTREDMSETIDAIQEKLRPGNIASEAKDKVVNATTERLRKMTGSASETAQNAVESTRRFAGELAEGKGNNAIPAVMIGVGVAWLLADRFRSGSRQRDWRRYGDRQYDSSYATGGYYEGEEYNRSGAPAYGAGYAGYEGEYGTSGSSLYGGSENYERGSSRLQEARETARRTGRRAQNGFQRLMQNNPLMVGAAAMAVGAAIGLALPETERENEWMGEARDSMIERAQDMAKDAASRAQEAVGEAAGEIASRVVTGKESDTDRRT